MPVKHFVVTPEKKKISKSAIQEIEKQATESANKAWEERNKLAAAAMGANIPLIAPEGKIIVKCNLEYKNEASFNGGKIRLERQFNNLNRRETEPVNAWVVDAKNIPAGAEILIHHNSTHDTYRIFDCEDLIEGGVSNDVKYFSIPENNAFLWRMGEGEWNPIEPFATALRVFRPYEGVIEGIPPTQLKNALFVTSGDLKGKVVSTIKASDYCIVFNDMNAKEHMIIRFRPDGDVKNDYEPEAQAVLDEITEGVLSGKLLVGYSEKDATKWQ